MQGRTLNVRVLLWSLGTLLLVAAVVHVVNRVQVDRNAGTLLIQAERAAAAGELDQALTFYTHYLTFEPDDVDARAKFGLSLEKRAAHPGDKLRVLLTFEEVLQRDPSRKDIRFRLVHGYIQLNRLKEAIQNLHILLPQWDSKAEIEHMVGWCHEALGEYEAAAEAFARAIDLDPMRIDSYALLAEVLQKLPDRAGDWQRVLERMVGANATSYRAYLVRARFRKQENLGKEAAADVKKALELAPDEPAVVLAAADWAQAQGDMNDARALVQKGWALHPKNAALAKALAGLEIRAGRRADAIAILKSALKDMPKAWELHVLLIDLLIDDRQLTDAAAKIDELRRAGIPPALPDYLEARLAVERGHWSQALTLLEQARPDLEKLADWASRVHALMGLCYGQVSNVEQQVASFRLAVEAEPAWTAARFGLGQALMAAGRLDDAWLQFQQIRDAADAPAELWTALARVQIFQQLRLAEDRREWARVEASLKKAAEMAPDAVEVALLRAEMLAARGKFPEARTVLEEARDRQPDQPLLWAGLVDLAARQGDWPQADAVLIAALQKLGERAELLSAQVRLLGWRGDMAASQGLLNMEARVQALPADARLRLQRELAAAWARLGNSEQAAKYWQRIAQEQPKDIGSRMALFEHALHNGQQAAARDLSNDIRKLEGEQGNLWRWAAASLLVNEAGRDAHKLTQAAKALEVLARRQPDWPRVPLLQAQVAERRNQLDEAVVFYTQAVDLGDRHTRHAARLVQLLAQFKDYVSADLVLRKLEANQPLPPELAKLGTEITLSLADNKRAAALAKLAVPADSRDYRDLIWLSRVHHRLGDAGKAEELARQATARAPHAPDTWIALVRQLVWSGKRDEAVKAMAEAGAKAPAKVKLFTLARCHDALGALDEADKAFQTALAQTPDDFVLLAAASDFYLRADQPGKAEPVLRRLLKASAAAPLEFVFRGRRQLALALVDIQPTANFSKALALLDANLKAAGDNPADARARAYVKGIGSAAERTKALAYFEESAKRQPLTDDDHFLFAKLLAASDDLPRAREQIESLLAAQPENPQYLAFGVALLARAEDMEAARAAFQKLVQLEPGSPRVRALKARFAF